MATNNFWLCRTQIKMEIVLAELEYGEVGYSEHVKMNSKKN